VTLDLQGLVHDVPDHPRPGILFKDLTPLLAHPEGLREVVRRVVETHPVRTIDVIAGIEARGFLFAAPVAVALGVGVVPVRKAGRLPRAVHERSYDLEYGTATLEVHQDAFLPGQRVLLMDDVLATGGTAAAAVHLIERCGAVPVGLSVVLEIAFLSGRRALGGLDVQALLTA
jgi:adenine phosphoribosyltransferase